MRIGLVTRGMGGPIFLSAFLSVILVVTAPAKSITINLTFDSVTSDSPSFDTTGTLLQPIMQAAASFWEDIIEDTWTIDIEYYYDDLPGGILALHNNLDGGLVAKPTTARVRFDTQLGGSERLWYFDQTPTDHSEYDLQQVLYGDLNAANQSGGASAWFNGAPPSQLEVGYRGSTVVGAPADAVNGFDLFSSALHEIGHAVGLTGNVASPETSDGDYDVNPVFVSGAVMGIVDSNNHLATATALMCSGCGATNVRRMLTATDVFAAAAASGWTQIDLRRIDFGSGSDWGLGGNWIGGRTPDGGDDVFIRHGGTVTYSGPSQQIRSVTIGANSVVHQQGSQLNPSGSLTLGNGGQYTIDSGLLDVNTAGTAEFAVALVVGSDGSGTVNHNGGTVRVNNGDMILAQSASGSGLYHLNGGMLDMQGNDILAGLGAGVLFDFAGGTLKNAATIDLGQVLVQQGGTLAPGGSIGTTDIIGGYTLGAGTVEIELGGAGNPLDLIQVAGDIDISIFGTTLDLRALGGMTAGTYTILQATGGVVTGVFENVTGLNPFGVIASVQYGTDFVSITLDRDLIFSDLNLDGFVGIEDLNFVLGNWNQVVTPGDRSLGDLTGDGFIGIEDLNLILGSWNVGTLPPVERFSQIPEPSALSLLALGTVGIVRRRRY